MASSCSVCQNTSASNLNWDVLNDSDFKSWVKYFGIPCLDQNTFTSHYIKLWSSLVISLIDGYNKCRMQNLHDMHVWQDETASHLLHHQKLKANLQYMRLYQKHYIENTNIYISGCIRDYSHLELTGKSWFVSRHFKSFNMGKGQMNACYGISKHTFQIKQTNQVFCTLSSCLVSEVSWQSIACKCFLFFSPANMFFKFNLSP